jgi:phenylpropionate dioxygenase-like ring-hydroxylating dioxygenase large terminal subunit
MQTSIRPDEYCSPEVLTAEQRSVLRRVWTFIGLRRDLEKHLDYVTRDIAGVPIVVQNFDGTLHAFENVCSHRFSRIQCDPRGNRPLQCRYHGWTYNSEGLPYGIPERPRFDDLTPERLQSLRLTRWQLASTGQMLFVAPTELTISLEDFLGEAGPQVAAWSSALGTEVDRSESVIECNWKTLVENTLEAYHVPLVHPKTFDWMDAKRGVCRIEGVHSSFTGGVDEKLANRFRKVESLFRGRPVSIDGYAHQLVFPNVTLATTWGATFSLQVFEPLGPASTRFTTTVYLTRTEGESPRADFLEMFGKSVAEGNRAIFEEDRVACERVQSVAGIARSAGILSDEEVRVGAFHQAYRSFRDAESGDSP